MRCFEISYIVNVNILRRKSRRLVLVLLGIPCLLLLISLRITQGRPHLFSTQKSPTFDISFSEDGKSVCLTDENSVKCFNNSTGQQVSASYGNVSQHRGPFYFKDEGEGNISYEIRGEKIKAAPAWEWSRAMTSFSPDKRVVTLAMGDEVKQWDFQQARFLWTTHFLQPKIEAFSRDVDICALSPDGTLCVVARDDDCSNINWIIADCRSGKVIAPVKYPGMMNSESFRFSPDGRTLCVRTYQAFYFLDSHTARLLWKEKVAADEATEPHYTPGGLVGIPSNKGFALFDTRTGKSRHHLDAPVPAQVEVWNFSPEGKQFWWSTPRNQVFWLDLK